MTTMLEKEAASVLLSLLTCLLLTTGSVWADEDQVLRIAALVADKKYNQALAEAGRLSHEKAADPKFHLVYAELLLKTGNQAAAIRELTLASRLSPGDPGPLILLSDLYLDNLELEQSLDCASRAVSIAPRNAAARIAYVRALLKSDQTGEAERQLKWVLHRQAGGSQVQLLAFELARKKKDYPAARQALAAVMASSSNPSTELSLSLAELLEESGDYGGAVACLEQLMKQRPDAPEPRLRLARILEVYFQDFDRAAVLYGKEDRVRSAEALAGVERCRRKQRDVAWRWKLHLHRLFSGQTESWPSAQARSGALKR